MARELPPDPYAPAASPRCFPHAILVCEHPPPPINRGPSTDHACIPRRSRLGTELFPRLVRSLAAGETGPLRSASPRVDDGLLLSQELRCSSWLQCGERRLRDCASYWHRDTGSEDGGQTPFSTGCGTPRPRGWALPPREPRAADEAAARAPFGMRRRSASPGQGLPHVATVSLFCVVSSRYRDSAAKCPPIHETLRDRP